MNGKFYLQNNSLHTMKFCSKEHFKYLKGIAILCVLIGHVGNYSGKTWFTPLGGIGVALFLFCSGYGLMMSYRAKGLKSFWRNRLVSFYLPFAFAEVIAAIFLRRQALDVFLDLLFIKRLNPLGWYIQYLVCCYGLFWVVVRFISDRKVRFAIWGGAALLSFFVFDNLQAEQAVSFLGGLVCAESMFQKNEPLNKKEKFTGGGLPGNIEHLWLPWDVSFCFCQPRFSC